MNFNKIVLTSILLFNLVIMINVVGLMDYIIKGKIFFGNDITMQMKDVTWAKLPIQLRERISQNSQATKFALNDIDEALAYYNDLRKNYKDTGPISLQDYDKTRKVKKQER